MATKSLETAGSGPSTSLVSPSVKHLVLDTAAIITGVRLEGIAQHYYTIEEVVREVRDARARQRLDSLPFKLEIRRPSEESMRFGESLSSCCARGWGCV